MENTYLENKLPSSTNPEEKFLDALWKFYYRIGHRNNKEENNMLEQYNYFVTHSSTDRNCTYALKTRSIFMEQDYPEIKLLLLEVIAKYKGLEDGRK